MEINYLTDEQLRYRAAYFRESLGFGSIGPISGIEALERYRTSSHPPLCFRIVEDAELRFAEAEATPSHNLVVVRKSLYNAFVNGDPRAKFIILEELCHLLLRHQGVMHRTVANDFFAKASKTKARQEREAKCMASLIIAPDEGVISLTSIEEIAKDYGMSTAAAAVRFEQTDAERRKRLGQKREFSPDTVAQVRRLESLTGFKVPAFDQSND